ncbi:prenyltransferase/squalene oxidase repeat-containing protein [Rosistilla oblonga]|uniref:Squalene--hopene cyclase n=1 Tax=Rosistilla oblonga TaxID=2527990 RepID=A0A518IRS6_9BACT|nr:prenyltransferase/squalene oxidase repeat-containing protein [Rosistilla oblonga]QDV55798.1 hypothetical protein Mal33_17770 [Rosistilla oblonga]
MSAPPCPSFTTAGIPPSVVPPPRDRWRTEPNESAADVAVPTSDFRRLFDKIRDLRKFDWRTIDWRLENTPPWVISMFLHLSLLLALAFITLAASGGDRALLTLRQGEWEPQAELAEFVIDPIAPLELPIEAVAEVQHEPEFDLRSLLVDQPTVETVAMASSSPMLDQLIAKTTPSADLTTPIRTAHRAMFAGRSGPLKAELLKKYGGTEVTENAVALGLAWLKRQQLPGGNWSMRGPYTTGSFSENETAATAMAMLAFMGAGSTHLSGPYEKELLRAVRWLVKQQDRSGFMAHRANSHEKMYAQSQAMIALCELYAMTKDSWLRPYAQAACDFAKDSQSPAGGWRYQPRTDSDTSVTGWFLMGLKSGQTAGLEVDPDVLLRVGKFLDTVGGGYDDGYAYMQGERSSPTMTAVGLLCRQYLGWQRNHPAMSRGLITLEANYPIDPGQPDVYYWYYATQAMHHYGGPLWDDWNANLRVDLPAMQDKQGAERGSWPPQRDAWGRLGGRLYTTCFALYNLEVYYRHMPLYSQDQTDVW